MTSACRSSDGYIRHMREWDAEVLLTDEAEPRVALGKILAGEALADKRFDVTTTLCQRRDMVFSSH